MNYVSKIVKSGWIYELFSVHFDRENPGYWFVEVYNEQEDDNCNAHVVTRYMRVDTQELEAIRLFIEKNDNRKQFDLKRCEGGPLTIAVQCF